MEDLMTRASALLCASSLPARYATLVSGYMSMAGEVVISNAGHPPPLVSAGGHNTEVRATGPPIGLFCESQFSSTRLTLAKGDTLLMYTDGLTEAQNSVAMEYGPSRLDAVASGAARGSVEDLLQATIADQVAFSGSGPNADDVTVLALRRM
jgi:sigma-B regulation protein RsbU (phosphoserine phosphatase)